MAGISICGRSDHHAGFDADHRHRHQEDADTTDELAEWQLAMATAILAMLPPVAVVVFMQRLFVRGLVETEK
jgi:ABC-type sugar transport system, permease component